MDAKRHCELLMVFKNKGFGLSSYMGIRWFILKVVLIILVSAMMLSEDRVLQIAGFIIAGYLIGIIGASLRSYIVAKRNWAFQKELIDWDKVEAKLKGFGTEADGSNSSGTA